MAQEIVDTLMPKYKVEAEALLEKASNRLVKRIVADLVIEEGSDGLSISVPEKETPPNETP